MSEKVDDDFPFDDFPDEEFLSLDTSVAPQPQDPMTEGQRARAERNRQKALALKKARLTVRPYPEGRAQLAQDVHPIDGGPVVQKGTYNLSRMGLIFECYLSFGMDQA
jgi:hypothetical protein